MIKETGRHGRAATWPFAGIDLPRGASLLAEKRSDEAVLHQRWPVPGWAERPIEKVTVSEVVDADRTADS
jgi:hypothetical protein